MKPYDEQADLNLVAAYFTDRQLSAERFSCAETQTGKTPDFRIRQDGAIVAYCEVKAPNDPLLDGLLEQASPFTILGGGRCDPVFNRLARLIIRADAQFSAVNPSRAELNLLAYVNHDSNSRFNDLVETLTGYFHADDGTKHPTMMHIAEGRIGKAQRRIDAFLWFEVGTDLIAPVLINDDDTERSRRVRALLDSDRLAIR